MPAAAPVHAAERRRRWLMSGAMAALAAIAVVLAAQQLWGSPPPLARVRTDGPYHATIGADGSVAFGPAVQAFRAGEVFGWASAICTAPDTGMLMQVRLVRLADNAVLLYRERNLPGDDRGCAAVRWGIQLPAGTPAGPYQLQRFLLATPRLGPPATRTLSPIAVEVLP